MKRCPCCGETKPLSEFHLKRGATDGLQRVCKVCNCAAVVAWNREHGGRKRNTGRLRKYGLTPEQFDVMDEAQEGRCAICGDPFAKTPHIDHDHDTDRVRRLLCPHCNRGLGAFRDKIELLLLAADYLRQHGKAAVHEEFTVVQPATRETA